MTAVPIQIVRFVLEHQPNIVECVLVDAFGRRWSFEDKHVYFTDAHLDEQSHYPQPGILPCTVGREWTDERGRHLVTIDTAATKCLLTATTGETQFDVLSDQITTCSD